LNNIAEVMEPEEALPFLTWIYEHTTCSMCRGFAAKTMIDQGTLPDSYLREMQFDADHYARELADNSFPVV